MAMVGEKSNFKAVRLFPWVALKNLLVPYKAPVSKMFEWLASYLLATIPIYSINGHEQQNPPTYQQHVSTYI